MKGLFLRRHNSHDSLKVVLIVVLSSILVITLPVLLVVKTLKARENHRKNSEHYTLKAIVQTGPQKRALPTQYLAQLLDLSVDDPRNLYSLSLDELYQKLYRAPFIAEAYIERAPPHALYIDYTLRTPLALLGAYDNIALDHKGILFPLFPYYTPKILPVIYLPDLMENFHPKWGEALNYPKWAFVMELLKSWQEMLFDQGARLRAIDMRAYQTLNIGREEIVFDVEFISEDKRILVRSLDGDINRFEELLKTQKNALLGSESVDLRTPNAAFLKR